MNLIIIMTFILYLGLMLGIGAYYYKKTNNLSDYVLGGRKLGKWVTSMSAQASDMSGWVLMGLPGAAFVTGLSGSIWMALGLAIGTYLNWLIVAKRLRIATEQYGDAITLSGYFKNRFNDTKNGIKIASSLLILVFFLIYTASAFVAGGKLFSTVFGLDYHVAVVICAVVVVGYTFMGGFLAVCWTDLIQGTLMVFALVLVPLFVIAQVGGVGNIISTLDASMFNAFDKEILVPTGASENGLMMFIGILSSFSWGLGYFGQPHILTRFMAIKNPEHLKDSRRIATVWVVISLGFAIFIGMIGRSVIGMVPQGEEENVFITLVIEYMPLALSGIFLSAVLAAIMSTADSQLLVTASAVSEDLYKGIYKPNASQKELVWIGRVTVLLVAAASLFIAFNPENSVLGLVAWAWAGFGASFGPVIVISLFWNKMTKKGALMGMLAGGLVTLVWPILKTTFSDIWLFYLYELLPGFILGAVVIYSVSYLDQKEMQRMEQYVNSINN